MSDLKECFKEIPEFNTYSISNLGNVIRTRDGFKIKPVNCKSKQLITNLFFDYETVYLRVDKTVARLFLDPPEDPSYVLLHIDGDPKNCRVDNLKWISEFEMYQINPDYRCGTLWHDGKLWTKDDFSEFCSISRYTLQTYLKKGMTTDEIIKYCDQRLRKLTINGVSAVVCR